MEISQADLRIGDNSVDFTSVSIKKETNGELIDSYDSVKIGKIINNECQEERVVACSRILQNFTTTDPNLNAIQHNHNESSTINNLLIETLYVNSLDETIINSEITKRESTTILDNLNIQIKKEAGSSDETYSTEWLCDVNDDPGIKLKITKSIKLEKIDDLDNSVNFHSSEVDEQPKRKIRQKSVSLPDCRERLRKKAERMRERRKKLYETETANERLERLAKEAAKRREMRMYYETPDQKRKRLDIEAARKREYRMYNETPDERRIRLDREAERRRLKRLSLYANETPEQRRERLNKESAKRREARLNQYAKESVDERKERLKRDAIRAREMRFTRSAIETEEERRDRLIKDAMRKRELRILGRESESNFTELQTIRSFDDLNDSNQMKNEFETHYMSNWMMWFQNTLTQQVQSSEESQSSSPSK
ncbi:trichohyalin-like [Leptopilina heterotoma]|uniref:trichohyalin-like n=1 Tax=Leptopilina heterotoma TaxID=63436 RepID=UPI001CA7CE05|nr:trichohyalin-like [Leptopilina heterotoma]